MIGAPSHDDLARGLFGPVLAAGALQLAYRRSGVVREEKADASAVTRADRDSEALLTTALKTIAPHVPVIAEEAVAAGHIPSCDRTLFLIDPLDGTEEYVRGGDDFTVNVGLVVDGTPTFGIIYAPARRWMCVTRAADRATEAEVVADPAISFDSVAWHDMRARERPEHRVVAVASRSHPDAAEDAWLKDIGVHERVSVGSSLKFCLVARGEADVYPRFKRISEWDTAAGHAILLAAGGRVEPRDGKIWRYGDREGGFRAQSFIAWGRARG